MSIKLTDTQIVMLSAAAQRDDRCLIAPPNLKGGAAQKVAAKLIGGGLAKEIKAKPGAPVWRQDEGSRTILCAEAHGRGREGDPRRRPLGFGRQQGGIPTSAYSLPRLIQKSRRLLQKFRQRTPYGRPRPEPARSWRGSSNCFSAIVAQR